MVSLRQLKKKSGTWKVLHDGSGRIIEALGKLVIVRPNSPTVLEEQDES